MDQQQQEFSQQLEAASEEIYEEIKTGTAADPTAALMEAHYRLSGE